MKLIINFILLNLSSSFPSFAQNYTIFINEKCKPTTIEKASHKRIIEKNKIQSEMDFVSDYYLSGEKFMEAECYTMSRKVVSFNGKCTYFYINGNKSAEGIFNENVQIGTWKYWSDDGIDSTVATFNRDGNQTIESNTYTRLINDNSAYLSKAPAQDKMFNAAEKQAEFPGGIKKFFSFIISSIEYPKIAQFRKFGGKVIVYFEIDKSGAVTNVILLTRPGLGIEQEAERIIRNSPKWSPASQNGKPVRVKHTLPVSFKIPR